jgi:hypothetical protein
LFEPAIERRCCVEPPVLGSDVVLGAGCRFEGDGAPSITCTGTQIQGLTIRECTFGQTNANDILYSNIAASTGLESAYIENNIHLEEGMVIPKITRSYISVVDKFVSYANTITVTTLIANSVIEASDLNATGAVIYGSVINQNDPLLGEYRTQYGPNTPLTAGQAQGSVLVNKAFGAAPVTPVKGSIVTASAAQWNPLSVTTSQDAPLFYDGTKWIPMIAIPSSPASSSATGTAGIIAFDSSNLYVCTATNTWRKVSLSSF